MPIKMLVVYMRSGKTTTVKFDIWDKARQERYHSLAPIYIYTTVQEFNISSLIFLLKFMKTFPISYWFFVFNPRIHLLKPKNGLKNCKYMSHYNKTLTLSVGSHKLVMALVANKSDLEPNREVEAKEAEKFAHESGVFYIETSVKTGENINDLFYEIDK
ncbi:hypothetical protein HN51_026871 [Arachis hypogaea]